MGKYMVSIFFLVGCLVYLVNFSLLAARKLMFENQLRQMTYGENEKFDMNSYVVMINKNFDEFDRNRYIDLFFISFGTLTTGAIFGIIGYFVEKFI